MKNNNFSELMSYAGRYKYLTYASLILSVISAVAAMFKMAGPQMAEDMKPLPDSAEKESPMDNSVEFKNVSFRYNKADSDAVHNISFSVNSGKTIALFSTYRESGKCRIRLAEKLRKFPLSFFGKRDIADLTNTILGDVTATEHMFSHCLPQFYASIISTCIIAISLFFYDWRLALSALWVLPAALLIVGLSGKVQNYFSRKQNAAQIAVQDGVQEYLETVRDLKSNNAETKYLEGLFSKIDTLEKRHIKSELGIAIFLMPAQMIMKLGIATVALVGSMLLYEPMSFSLQNLAAINSLKINIDRMNEIENCL